MTRPVARHGASLHELLRRLVAVVALVSAALTALAVLALLALTDHGTDGHVDVLGLAALAGTVLGGAIGLGVLHLVLRRHRRGLAHLGEQLAVLGDASGALPRVRVGLREIDEPNEDLADRTVQIARRQSEARDAAADASHQLRTPLTALLMRLDEIASTDDLTVVRDEASVATSQVERLAAVVDALLTRTKGGEVARPEISLDSVLAGLQREYQPAFGGAKRSMRVEGERGLVVRASPADLVQVLQSLVENALDHGSGTVTVEARRSGSSAVVEVRDEGQGVPAAIAPHIFERSVTSRGSGLGLGLARQIVERNGGRLELVQARPAVFAVFLSAPGAR